MSDVLVNLIRLQNSVYAGGAEKTAAPSEEQIAQWRNSLPETILCKFDRLAAQGHLPLAQLTPSGACGGCHMKLPISDALAIQAASHSVGACPFCGRFLCSRLSPVDES